MASHNCPGPVSRRKEKVLGFTGKKCCKCWDVLWGSFLNMLLICVWLQILVSSYKVEFVEIKTITVFWFVLSCIRVFTYVGSDFAAACSTWGFSVCLFK